MVYWVLYFLCVGLMPTDARHFETAQVCNVFISNLVLLINPGTSQESFASILIVRIHHVMNNMTSKSFLIYNLCDSPFFNQKIFDQ